MTAGRNMLIQYTHYPTIVTDHKTHFFTYFVMKNKKIMMDHLKGLLMTHDLDILMSGKNLGLNGLRNGNANQHTRSRTDHREGCHLMLSVIGLQWIKQLHVRPLKKSKCCGSLNQVYNKLLRLL